MGSGVVGRESAAPVLLRQEAEGRGGGGLGVGVRVRVGFVPVAVAVAAGVPGTVVPGAVGCQGSRPRSPRLVNVGDSKLGVASVPLKNLIGPLVAPSLHDLNLAPRPVASVHALHSASGSADAAVGAHAVDADEDAKGKRRRRKGDVNGVGVQEGGGAVGADSVGGNAEELEEGFAWKEGKVDDKLV